jgi:hypothetical protein
MSRISFAILRQLLVIRLIGVLLLKDAIFGVSSQKINKDK